MEGKLDRDSLYRIHALECAVNRAGQDGGLEGTVDVLGIAEIYFAWLSGEIDTKKPTKEGSDESIEE